MDCSQSLHCIPQCLWVQQYYICKSEALFICVCVCVQESLYFKRKGVQPRQEVVSLTHKWLSFLGPDTWSESPSPLSCSPRSWFSRLEVQISKESSTKREKAGEGKLETIPCRRLHFIAAKAKSAGETCVNISWRAETGSLSLACDLGSATNSTGNLGAPMPLWTSDSSSLM